jgi:hypothetical protein
MNRWFPKKVIDMCGSFQVILTPVHHRLAGYWVLAITEYSARGLYLFLQISSCGWIQHVYLLTRSAN